MDDGAPEHAEETAEGAPPRDLRAANRTLGLGLALVAFVFLAAALGVGALELVGAS